ncbi:MAG: NTPase [Methanothrix sp.]|jgi:nucleoside-triphosphatase|nr:NTPase [Methanothrix sp.]MDD4579514.1 NTPase [Methanothrix sp.]
MAPRIAVTGSPGIGKSTMVAKVVQDSKRSVGGVLARDRRYKDRRIGFELLDLSTGAVGILADETGSGPQLGKYRVHPEDLDNIGAHAIESALKCDLIVVDEVGPMELSSRRFVSAVENAISSDRPMLVVLHEWSNHRLAKKIRSTFKVITVTRENRDTIAQEISRALFSGV